MQSKVSVIIPTYNYGRFIKQAIESVLAQTYPIWEVIVVDDGSTDETRQIVRSFGKSVHYIRQDNRGVCAARNIGTNESTGDFVAFLDADDYWHPQKVEKQSSKFRSDPELGLVHCGMREFNSESDQTIRFHLEGDEGWVANEMLLFEKTVIIGPGGSIMVKRQVFDELEGFDFNLKIGEDWDFCYRAACKFKVGFVREPLVNYRNHGQNSHLDIREMERSTMIAWGKAFATKDKETLHLRRRSFGNLHKVLAGSYLQAGHHFSFFRNLLMSLWYQPMYLGFYFKLLFSSKR